MEVPSRARRGQGLFLFPGVAAVRDAVLPFLHQPTLLDETAFGLLAASAALEIHDLPEAHLAPYLLLVCTLFLRACAQSGVCAQLPCKMGRWPFWSRSLKNAMWEVFAFPRPEYQRGAAGARASHPRWL